MIKKRILFRVDGYKEISMGHIYRCLTIAKLFNECETIFVTTKKSKDGIHVLMDSGVSYSVIDEANDIFSFIHTWLPDIIVIDCLNSTSEFMIKIKSMVNRVISIEDVGDGSKYADVVINALYDDDSDDNKYFYGYKYHCLRSEFMNIEPKKFSENVTEIIITFGGADPSNLTKKLYSVAKSIHNIYPKIHFTIVCGLVYDYMNNGIISDDSQNISVYHNIHNISYYMRKSDIAVTSQGSAIFELASLGIPSIVIAQNKREQLHTFASEDNGFLNLGLGDSITSEVIQKTLCQLIENTNARKLMRYKMLKTDLKKGAERVAKLIIGG